jgi:hypothetical protein
MVGWVCGVTLRLCSESTRWWTLASSSGSLTKASPRQLTRMVGIVHYGASIELKCFRIPQQAYMVPLCCGGSERFSLYTPFQSHHYRVRVSSFTGTE